MISKVKACESRFLRKVASRWKDRFVQDVEKRGAPTYVFRLAQGLIARLFGGM